jgi:hypothetical protein
MIRTRLWLVVGAVASAWFYAPLAGEAALARSLGRPRYTARLSSNPAIRRQQLIVDPEDIVGGSVSLTYDPRVVHLVDVIDPASFRVTGGFVSVTHLGLASIPVPLSEFLSGGRLRGQQLLADQEVGYVQIFFDKRGVAGISSAAPAASAIPNLPGYQTVDEDGPTGISDTHALIFDYLAPVGTGRQATYSIFASSPRQGTGADSLTALDDPRPIPYTEISSAFVSGSLLVPGNPPPHAVPLPAAAWSGSVMLVVLGGAWGRRRRVAATS